MKTQIAGIRTICNCGETLIKDYQRMLCLSCGQYFGPDEPTKVKSAHPPKKVKQHRLIEGEKRGCIQTWHRWTEGEKEIVRTDYKQTRASMRAIVDRLRKECGVEVTIWGVQGQVQLLGLSKKTGRKNWNESQDGRLRELAGKYPMVTIARKMNRSINSVVVRSKRLGIYRRDCHDGWYTKKEVCEIFGVDHKRVQCFIDSGYLRASYHHERRPSKKGLAYWHVEEEAVASFLKRHPEQLTGRNVDLIQIVQILMRNQHAKLSSM